VHFDHWAIVVVHVAGTKRWRVQRSPAIAWPLSPARGLDEERRPDYAGPAREWERDDAAPVNDDDFETVTMRPGDVLYMPAGAFHATETLDERATALHFHFFPVHMADVIRRFIDRTMSRDASWRAAPIGHPPAPLDARTSAAHVRSILGERIADLKTALAADSLDDELFATWQAMSRDL